MGNSPTTEGSERVQEAVMQRSAAVENERTTESADTIRRNTGSLNEADLSSEVGYWAMIRNGYGSLVNLIIRPPRVSYSVEELGPENFVFGGKNFIRNDVDLMNSRGLILKCSHWQPSGEDRPAKALPCLIYLHGNSSCRLEAISVLTVALAHGMTVFAFDFSGCGQSEGEYISLGFFEKDDVGVVMKYLRSTNEVSTMGIWGRSMGAATALLHGHRDHSIAGIIIDSAFTNLEQLAKELVESTREQGFTIPGFIATLAMRMIRSSVMKKAHFDIRQLAPIESAKKMFIPALFVHAEGDAFIRPHHSRQIYEKYAGDKNIIMIDGDHNSSRPQFLYDSAAIFLQAALQVPTDYQLSAPMIGNIPPWITGLSAYYKDRCRYPLYIGADFDFEAAVVASLQDSVAQLDISGESKNLEEQWICSKCAEINAHSYTECITCGENAPQGLMELCASLDESTPGTFLDEDSSTEADLSETSKTLNEMAPGSVQDQE